MKKILSLTLALVMLVLCAAPALAINIRGVSPGDTLYVKTSGGSLNLREEPTAKAAKIAKLPYADAVTAMNGYQDGYLQVSWKGKTGWVDIKYLSADKPSGGGSGGGGSTEKETVASLGFKSMKLIPADTTYVVASKPSRAGGFVNLRWVPSTESAIIKRMYAGEELTVICEGSKWLQVMSEEGYVGFVQKAYTSVVFYGTTEDYDALLNAAEAQ